MFSWFISSGFGSELRYIIIILYFAILTILCIYGFHRYFLVTLFNKYRKVKFDTPELPTNESSLPVVTVQLPLFNERTVAERIINSMRDIDYPKNKLEIQVLDDSTDNTVKLCKSLVKKLKKDKYQAVHLHRIDRTGYKAGALEKGMEVAKGELLAIFDADFIPPADFLKKLVPYFLADSKIGMVQSRWGHINREFSQLTRTQAVMLDAHFVVEHFARNRSGRFFNFNGTAGIWRKQAIIDAGGWEHETITEDMDLSYRSQLAGWKFLFVPEVVSPAELPVEMDAFKSQQYRWAKGSTQVCLKMLGTILKSKASFKIKAEAFVHLTANFCYLLMFFLSLLMVPAIYARLDGNWMDMLLLDMPVFLFGTMAVIDYFATSQRGVDRKFLPAFRDTLFVISLGLGLSINNARAVVSALLRRESPFVRTPKLGLDDEGKLMKIQKKQKKYSPQKSLLPYVELFLGLFFWASIVWAFHVFAWPSIPFLLLFAIGYTYVGSASLIARIKTRISGHKDQ